MIWKFELLLSSRAEIFSKIKRFVDVFWKFELPLSSRAKLWQKYGKFYEVTWKFTAPIITSWNFRENIAVLLKCFENLNCPYYYELKCLQKLSSFDNVTWQFALPLLSRGQLFPKINQLCWCDLKIWPAPIITSWNVSKK